MAEFKLDTRGEVRGRRLIEGSDGSWRSHWAWSDLDDSVREYIEAALRDTFSDMRVVAEDENGDIAKADATPHHWTIFPSGDDWTVLATFATEAEARAFVAPRFDRLAAETLARIIADCAAFEATWHNASGSEFWAKRQRGDYNPNDFPPLTLRLGDDGKVYFV
jgi:hypothetical protein